MLYSLDRAFGSILCHDAFADHRAGEGNRLFDPRTSTDSMEFLLESVGPDLGRIWFQGTISNHLGTRTICGMNPAQPYCV